MRRLLTVVRQLAAIILANFVSGTFLIICGFAKWDSAAATATVLLSCCTVYVEVANKSRCINRNAFTNILILSVLLGGASAFFWFFHMIYKVGHYKGDYLEILWSVPTRMIAFGISIYLILRAHGIYTALTLEVIDDLAYEDATPLSKTNLCGGDVDFAASRCSHQKELSNPV